MDVSYGKKQFILGGGLLRLVAFTAMSSVTVVNVASLFTVFEFPLLLERHWVRLEVGVGITGW